MSLATCVRLGLVSSLAFIWLNLSLRNLNSHNSNRRELQIESGGSNVLETPILYAAGEALPHFTADVCDRLTESVGVLYGSTQRAFSGTAFSLGPDPRDTRTHLFLTAAHCVEGRQPPFVIATRTNQDATWQWHTANVRYVDSVRDLALLAVPHVTDSAGLRVATMPDAANIGKGDRVLVHGYPDRAFTLYETRVVKTGHIKIDDDQYTSVVIDGPVIGGQSGSPVLNQAGRVIGVVTRGNAEQGTCVHASDLHSFLELADLTYLCNMPKSLASE